MYRPSTYSEDPADEARFIERRLNKRETLMASQETDMKALVLSGGKGTRLRPFTYYVAKQLIPVANRPVLTYVIDNIAHAGIKEVGIVISPQTGDQIREAIGDGSMWDVNIEYIVQDEPRGLAHAVFAARDFLGNDPFVMYLGDNIIGSRIDGFVKTFKQTRSDALMVLKPVKNPVAFGVAEFDSKGMLKSLTEKPRNPKSNLAIVGIYVFTPGIHAAIDELTPSERGELEISDAVQKLIDKGRHVHGNVLETWWHDTGSKDDLLAANTSVLEEWCERNIQGSVNDASGITGNVTVEKGAVVRNSTLRGPIVIGSGAVIEDSFVGPFTSIGPDSRITRSILGRCMILPGAEISRVEWLEDSVIGRNARVVKRPSGHDGLRVMISDDSIVEV